MNTKAYIEGLFLATPGLELYDITEGTNIYDLIVAPLMQIFEDAIGKDDIASIAEIRSWESLYDVPLEYLKNIATVRGLTLSSSTKSSTLVTLHFSSPIDWDIPAGTTLSSGDVTFLTRDTVSITSGLIENNVDSKGLYCYYDLFVYNDNGDSVGANQLGYVTNAPPELMSVTHSAVTNGKSDETVYSIIDKLKNKEMSITASSANSIKNLIYRYLPDVSIAVITPGDQRMKRDMVYNMVPGTIAPMQESTFLGKIRRDVISNPNKAYFTCVPEGEIDNDANYDNDDEFVQGQYLAINGAVDSSVTLSTDNIMNETFTQSSERIGESSKVCSIDPVSGRYLSVEDADRFSSGDSINISDRTSAQPTQNGTVEEVNTYSIVDAAYTAATKTIVFTPGYPIPISEGSKIYVSESSVIYESYVDTVDVTSGEYTVVLVDAVGALGNCQVDLAISILSLYSRLAVAITDYTNIYADIVNAEGLYIGPGWIKSEHGMPIGTYLSENQVAVIDNKLVMGTNMSEKEINLVRQIFLRYGMNKMVTKIFENIDIKVGFILTPGQHTEPISTTHVEER